MTVSEFGMKKLVANQRTMIMKFALETVPRPNVLLALSPREQMVFRYHENIRRKIARNSLKRSTTGGGGTWCP